MIGAAPLSPFTRLPGWETPAEEQLLMDFAAQVPDGGQIVEIGSEWGMSTGALCKTAKPSVFITSVDLFPGNLLEQHNHNLALAGLERRTKQIQAKSQTLDWQSGQIDLLFVDGAHDYESVKGDIANWIKHVRIGGIVAFHDCACTTNRLPHVLHFQVTRAVSEWFWTTKGKWANLEPVDTILSFKRLK